MKNKLLRAFLIAIGVWLVCVGAAAVSIKLSKPAYAEQLERYYAPYNGESRVLNSPWYCHPLFYTYSLETVVPTDAAVEYAVSNMLEPYVEYIAVDSRTYVIDGDNVLVDYIVSDRTNKVISVKNDIVITVGSGIYEGVFSEHIKGVNIGDTVVFDYYSDELTGSTEKYTVELTLLSIREAVMPELTDDFVFREFGIKSVKDFEQQIRDDIETELAEAAEKRAYAQVAGAMLADCEYVINAEEVKTRSGAMLEEYSAAAELLGISLEEYLNSSGVLFTGGQISGDCMYYIQEQAMIDIQTETVTKYLAEKWNIRADEKEASELASSEGITPETAEYRLVEKAVTEKVLKLARKK